MRPLEHNPGQAPVAHRTILVLIVLTTALGPFALNVPLPSMPGMATSFGVPYAGIQLVLTLYLVALATGQFVYGPLSDRFGRRPMILTGVAVFATGSLACALAPTVEMLLLGRIVQGFGGCAGMVLGRAMLRDLYGRDRAASVIAYVTMAMVVAPMIAPALGGVLDGILGWRAGFALVAALGAMLLVVTAFQLPETHRERTIGAGFGALLRACRSLLAIPAFLAFAGVMAFTSAIFFSFLAGAPFIVVELMGRSPAEYGLWFISNAAGYMLGNFLVGRYAGRIHVMRLMGIGTVSSLVGVLILAAAMLAGPFAPASLFLPMTLVAFTNGLIMPTSIASAVSVRPELAGAASGLAGAMQMMLAAAATVLVAAVQDVTGFSLVVVIAVFAVLSAAGYAVALRYERS